MTHLLNENISGCFGADALDESLFQESLVGLQDALRHIQQGACPSTAALLALPRKTDDLDALQTLAQDIRARFDHVVIVGSGGSGLSGKMFAQLKSGKQEPKLHFLENIDPDLMYSLLNQIDISRSCFIIVSKSGSTAETVSQFHVLLNQVQENCVVADVAGQFVIITTVGDSYLRSAAMQHGMCVLDHPDDIGGRFSALTAVGLLPAALCGFDIGKVRSGAAQIVSQMDDAKEAAQSPGAKGAALHYVAMQSGKNISVMWPYAERLAGFSAWYRQSWAESLGKDGQGTTPLVAMGTTDQHSQLQLFLDGPKDKLFHLITVKRSGTGAAIHAPDELAYLKEKTLGDVMQAQQDATIATLIKNLCPVRVLSVDTLDEEVFGALLMQGTLEILFMAALLKVNPFDQPAVEDSKNLARATLLGAVT